MQEIGPYRVLSRLGAGGMGVAYRARDPAGQVVVVKVLRPELAEDPVGRRRLAREVDTMRRVRSPHVARILDADMEHDPPYLVTRYVPGPSLRDHVERHGPLRGAALQRLATGLAEAVCAIHEAGVVHRDITPGNVLLIDGDPVVIDFGIAWAVDFTRLTMAGAVVGTPGYLAVELLDGADMGPPVDVFAVGATLAFAAGGRHPFGSGPLPAIHYRMAMGRVDLTGVPPAMEPPLRAALSPDPVRRPTARRLHDMLRGLDPRGLDVGEGADRRSARTAAGEGAPADAGATERFAPAGAATDSSTGTSTPPGGSDTRTRPLGAPNAAAGGPRTANAGGADTAAGNAPAGNAADRNAADADPRTANAGEASPGAANPGAASPGATRGTAAPGARPRIRTTAGIPILIVAATLALTALPVWVLGPWGLIAGAVFTWLRVGYSGPRDVRSLAVRLAVEAVVAAGAATAAIWGLAIVVRIVGYGA